MRIEKPTPQMLRRLAAQMAPVGTRADRWERRTSGGVEVTYSDGSRLYVSVGELLAAYEANR